MSLLRWVSFQNIVVVIFLLYLYNVGTTFYRLLNPHLYVSWHDQNTGKPLPTLLARWQNGVHYNVEVFLSEVRVPRPGNMVKIWRSEDIAFTDTSAANTELTLTSESIGRDRWRSLEENRTLFAHFLFKQGTDSIWKSSPLVRFETEPPRPPKRYLVKDWPVLGAFVPDEVVVLNTPASLSNYTRGFWKPSASALVVADWTTWPMGTMPRTVSNYLELVKGTREYLPVIYTDQLGLTKDMLIQINTTMETLPLRIDVGPMSLARWQFNAQMEEALKLQRDFGASEKDIDDLRHMLTETEPILLAVTMLVSLVHLLFDLLAFKSDISFWQNAKSTRGLSVRSLFTDLVSQLIITLYLYEQQASLLILAPSGLGLIVQLWKVQRAYSIGGQNTTAEFDNTATNRMLQLLMPVVIAYAVYSLVKEKHEGFWSWGIGSLASSVYAFGFVMMTPQIFINYKLKSVAQLPWKFFMYKAMNTFIDDLFAFIIRMPTMHRMSVFRDDIVFFIYLYQRWIYPVDLSRKHEMEEEDDSCDGDGKEELKKER